VSDEPVDVAFERPNPRVCFAWLASRLLIWLLVAAGLGIANGLGHLTGPLWQMWVFSPSFAWLIPPLHIAFPILAYRSWGFQLRSHDLLVRSGVLSVEYVAIPLSRVQQVDVTSGPFERLLGLSTLLVHTAGTRAARTRIPGLLGERAAALRDALSQSSDELG
jgi:membrane protein YdbS with pleckstrin-like domain